MNKPFFIFVFVALATTLLTLTAEAQQLCPVDGRWTVRVRGQEVSVRTRNCGLPRAAPAATAQPVSPRAAPIPMAVAPVAQPAASPLPPRPYPPRYVPAASPPLPPAAQPLPPPPPPGPTELRVADPGGRHLMEFEVVGEWSGWMLANGQPILSRESPTRGNQTVRIHVDAAVNLPGGEPGQIHLQMVCGGPRPRRLPPRWVWPRTRHQVNPIQGCW